jgi:hypothetical protein
MYYVKIITKCYYYYYYYVLNPVKSMAHIN